jgi:hypothetical protein
VSRLQSRDKLRLQAGLTGEPKQSYSFASLPPEGIIGLLDGF